jgi:hypothetical protein
MPVDPPFKLITREQVWPGQVPTSSDTTVRPKLARPATYATGHYTGSYSSWGDPDDTIEEVRRIQSAAVGARKPWEYNWVFDTQGYVVEYAGDYQGAHSLGENPVADGCLFLLGVGEQVSPEMILAFRQWRWWRIQNGAHDSYTLFMPHKDMPGAATPCPGDRVMAVWSQLAEPWEPEPTPNPPSDLEVDMLVLDWKPNTPSWTAFVTTGTHLGWVRNGHFDNVLKAAGTKRVTVTDAELEGALLSTAKTTPAPHTLTPALRVAWGA